MIVYADPRRRRATSAVFARPAALARGVAATPDAGGAPVLALPLGRLHSHALPDRAPVAWSLAALGANFEFGPDAQDRLLRAFIAAGGQAPPPANGSPGPSPTPPSTPACVT